MFGGNFEPNGWRFCNGQLLAISQNDPLFQLIGTRFGGDGQQTFALPDLRGRVPIHQGNGFSLAATGGAEEVTLTTQQIPVHSHALLASSSIGAKPTPEANLLAKTLNIDIYSGDTPDVNMAVSAVTPAGGSQPHTNFQPYLCVHFIISLFGLWPSAT